MGVRQELEQLWGDFKKHPLPAISVAILAGGLVIAFYERFWIPILRDQLARCEQIVRRLEVEKHPTDKQVKTPVERCQNGTIRLDMPLEPEVPLNICVSPNPATEPTVQPAKDGLGAAVLRWFVHDSGKTKTLATCTCYESDQKRVK